jgi:hypothetical protein
MDRGVFWIEAFAILASYLILTMPAASATIVKIYSSANPGSPLATVTYSPYAMLKRDVVINPPWDAPTVNIGISNSSSDVLLDSVLLYRCRGLNPSACMSAVQADSFEGSLLSEFGWTALADQTLSYPQKASLLVMARVNRAGKLFWTGLWIEIERASQQDFDVSEDDLDSLSIYMDDIGQVNTVKGFIGSNHMIPVNPLWITRVVFNSAASMYELGFNQPEDVEAQGLSGNEIASVSNNYTFILPVVSSEIKSPVTLYKSPSYVCGDSQCEGGKGESSSNCCLDCPCSLGYYCDISRGCRPESGIGLRIYGSFQPGVSNCYESHGLVVPLEIQNAPSGMSVVSAWYRLRSDQYATSCEHLSGSIYSCPVTVPAMPDCTEGVYMLGPNRVGMEISYPDGAGSGSRLLETELPYITIGSFSCGQKGCEWGIGESEGSCCYDCGCLSGYCDYETGGSPIDASCRPDPDGDDIYAAWMNPTHFSGFSGSEETVNMNVVMGNAPRSLVVTGTGCEMGCLKGGEPCTATCSIGCSKLPSTDPEKYNSSCTLSVSISGYDAESDYTLSPDVTFGVSYNNGSVGVVTSSITKTFNQISVGAHWCGDRLCTGEENQENCCYDCGCPGGQYCDTKNINGPTQGDGCKPVSGARLVVDGVGGLVLEDSMVEQVIPIGAQITEAPSGIAVSGTCSLASDPGIECVMYCQLTGVTASGTGVLCELHIPPIDYVTTGQPYYNPSTRVLALSPNSYEITVSYNNGPEKREDVYEESLGAVDISVISHCGEGGCEVSLGESQASCCRDCGCSGYGDNYFCYMGRIFSGECVDNSSILLEIVGLEPHPLVCTIGYMEGPCKFLEPVKANVRIINAPPDVKVADAYVRLSGQEAERVECEVGEEHGEFVCPFIPGNLEGSAGKENRSLELNLELSYTIGDIEVLQNIEANTTLEITRKKSDALISCENEVSRIQEQMDRLDSNKGDYETYSLVMYIIAVILMALFIYCIICSCSLFGACSGSTTVPSGTGWVSPLEPGGLPEGPSISYSGDGGTVSYIACAAECLPLMTYAMQMFMYAQSLDTKSQNTELQKQSLVQQMEAKRAMCSSESFGELAGAAGMMMPISTF